MENLIQALYAYGESAHVVLLKYIHSTVLSVELCLILQVNQIFFFKKRLLFHP